MKTKSTIKTKNLTLLGTAVLAGILSGLNPVSANPIGAFFVDDPRCDAPVGSFIEELGTAPAFPPEELIEVSVVSTNAVACPSNAVAGGNDDWEVSMTNKTNPPRSFTNVFFVSDALSVGNADGKIGGKDAFRIDRVPNPPGNLTPNEPLLSESQAADGVFAPNETWVFLVSDFAQAPTFGSLGLSSASLDSNANIVVTPEPTTMLGSLLVFGSGALLKGKIKKK